MSAVVPSTRILVLPEESELHSRCIVLAVGLLRYACATEWVKIPSLCYALPAPCFRSTCCASIPGALAKPYMCIVVELNELYSATPRLIISPLNFAADYFQVTNEDTILTSETLCFSYLIRERTRCLGRGAEPQRDKV